MGDPHTPPDRSLHRAHGRRWWTGLAPWGVLALCPSAAVASPVAPGNTFGVLGNWGGTDTAPYSTPGQVAAAAGLEAVAAATNMLFLVSTGGNFLPTGLPRACPPLTC